MAEAKEIVVLSDKARTYVDIYERMISPARPRWSDEVLAALWLGRVARNRRLARVRRITERIGQVRGEATAVLRELLAGARELKRNAESANALAIGSLTRARSDRDLARDHVEMLLASLGDTLRFVEERNARQLPRRWEDWPGLSLVIDDPSGVLPLERLVHHQRRWQALLQAIARWESTAAEITKAERSFTRSNQIEQRCARFLERLETEDRLVGRRFDDLEAEIRVGELESIVATLSSQKDGRLPLLEIGDFELLPPEDPPAGAGPRA